MGYINGSGDWSTYTSQVNFSGITDLTLAFVEPDSTGHFTQTQGLQAIVTAAHANHVRIYFSIGGGAPPSYMGQLLVEPARSVMIAQAIQVAATYGFDGVDVDLEGALLDNHYDTIISTLAAQLHASGRVLTTALPSWDADQVEDSTFQQLDFINVMSYDATGPWDPSDPGPTAPFSLVQSDFTYFHQTRGVPASKLLIGLPFYGYGFGGNAPSSITYRDIVADYPGAQNGDSVSAGGGVIYYNGIPTIEEKVQFALTNQAAGVMIWQLLQDSPDPSTSLLHAIDAKIGKP